MQLQGRHSELDKLQLRALATAPLSASQQARGQLLYIPNPGTDNAPLSASQEAQALAQLPHRRRRRFWNSAATILAVSALLLSSFGSDTPRRLQARRLYSCHHHTKA